MLDAEAKMDIEKSPTITVANRAMPLTPSVQQRKCRWSGTVRAQSMFYCGGKVLGAVAPSHCSCFTVDALKKHHSTKDVQTHDTTWFL